MTECPGATAGRPGDPEEKLVLTDGRPVPGTAVRVVDEGGRPVGPGVEGELELFGPQLCVGYTDAGLARGAFTPDGFVRSGDLGVIDQEGFLRITGRTKDIIIRKGENLSAKAIEDELHDHPRIAEAAVIGVPDREDIRVFMCARQAMAQKVPEQLELLAALPRNAMGKVLKHELRRLLGGGGPA
jgi:cyclohexanecarboxylate-CoA ligase